MFHSSLSRNHFSCCRRLRLSRGLNVSEPCKPPPYYPHHSLTLPESLTEKRLCVHAVCGGLFLPEVALRDLFWDRGDILATERRRSVEDHSSTRRYLTGCLSLSVWRVYIFRGVGVGRLRMNGSLWKLTSPPPGHPNHIAMGMEASAVRPPPNPVPSHPVPPSLFFCRW